MTARTARTTVWLLVLVPVLFVLMGFGLSDLASPAAVLNALGRLTGVAGLALLLLAAALSARVPGFDQPFGGLTRLWHTHHLLGAWSLILLLLHPILLAFSAAAHGTGTAFQTLFPPLSDIATWSGWLALVLMMVFLAPSFHFFGRPDYERWKLVHRLAGPAVILALVHTFYFSRTMPGWADVAIWSAFAALAVGAVVWRFVFSRRIGRLSYRVSALDKPANNVVELTLEPGKRRLEYQAGNFVYLAPFDRELDDGYAEEHPYTLSSSPREKQLRIAIKDLGDASRAIQDIRVGSKVTVEGPYGRFFKSPDRIKIPEFWVAGGIGITPFLARMRHLKALEEPANAHLVFCVQDEARAIFLEELTELAESLPDFHLHMHYFYQQGPISQQYLESACPDLATREIYICGPTPLNHLIQRHARAAGVPLARIHTEEFELL
ncbi:ferric reductase-like transmembrane domain-containing protein [Wenzhouxiangella sp. AB-CW3]|uniref:ferredoxin reductase family protein n=1 Tax=Wenzhouxiangella sp. AB-CW3 TaxID=2771012 RepID=UPI00168BE7FB|nr:ferric reductase-like transmembrane domain-containing protein [Wenzhouxiangella sp. AB-CW3]QOC23923.1 ferric reductase-like transmembrane domain-containing protein [Wenzhouxiangella sp. AB-CW3]